MYFFCGIINNTVKIQMMGLLIESIVSFPYNAFQTGQWVIGALTASWIHAEQFVAIKLEPTSCHNSNVR